jgi:excisionase family DNA binding protein
VPDELIFIFRPPTRAYVLASTSVHVLTTSESNMNIPLAYSIAEACEIARIGRTSIYEAINSGELIARKNGRRTLILSDDLRRWLQSLPTQIQF